MSRITTANGACQCMTIGRSSSFLLLEAAQAGLSWYTVLRKRESYRDAFAGFDPQKVARYGKKQIEALLKNPGIIRNRLKIACRRQQRRQIFTGSKRVRQLRRLHLALRRRQADRQSSQNAERLPGHQPGVGRFEQRFEAARFQVRRLDDHLRPHASHRHGQRSRRGLFSP